MRLTKSLGRPLALCIALNTTLVVALAQPAGEFTPRVGQAGKDVIWVPTPQTLVDEMLAMAKVGPGDYVIDLGSGDGRTVITAAKLGATAHGIEYNPEMVELSKRKAAKAGVGDKATFEKADIFASDFSKATVVTMFLLPGLNLRLRPILLDMRPGIRVVSNSFNMGDWRPDQIVRAAKDCSGYCRAYLWIIPADVDGTWRLGESELALEQSYQVFTGRLTSGNVIAPIIDGRLVADRVSFTAGGTRYTGRVNGDVMDGTSTSGGKEAKWRATRIK